MSATPTPASHHPAPRWIGLDSLRGLAVVAVVAYHLGYLPGGFLGVDVFFVLSGYLITALALLEIERSGSLGLGAFWGRRARRLAPAVFVMVPVVLVAALLSGWDRTDFGRLAWDATATLSWWENWRQAFGEVGGYWSTTPSLFRHAWSLAIEEQFYLTWPLLVTAAIALTRRRGSTARTVAVFAAVVGGASAVWSVTLAHRLADAGLSRVYLGTDTRILAPLTGCLLAALLHGRRLPERGAPVVVIRAMGVGALVGLGVLMVSVDVSQPSLYRSGTLILVALLAAVALFAARTLRSADRVTVWLGHRSYAIYLWSWPIQILLENRLPSWGRGPIALITLGLTLLIAEASWHLVEHPWIRRTSWVGRVRSRNLGASVSFLTAVSAVVVVAVLARPVPPHERIDVDDSLELALSTEPPAAGGVTDDDPTDGAPSESDPDDPARDPDPPEIEDVPERVMVLGDSTGFAIGFYAPDELPEGIASIDNRAVNGCSVLAPLGYGHPQLVEGRPFPVGRAPYIPEPLCAGIDEVIDVGLSLDPTVAVLSFGVWEIGPVQAPSGRILPARSPETTQLVEERILDMIHRISDADVRTVLAPVACPGPAESYRFLHEEGLMSWVVDLAERVRTRARSRGLEVSILPTPPTACVDGDPLGEATDAKNRAMGDEVHVADADGGAWLWDEWWGPAIVATGDGDG